MSSSSALDVRPPLVDLGVRAAGRVDDRGRRARLVLDPDEVVEDRLGGQLLDDPRPGAAAGEPGGDDGHAEPLQRAGDVDPLAAGERQPGARAVPLVELEVRHGQRAVDRGVEGDCDDHEIQLQAWCAACPMYQPAAPEQSRLSDRARGDQRPADDEPAARVDPHLSERLTLAHRQARRPPERRPARPAAGRPARPGSRRGRDERQRARGRTARCAVA